MRADNALRTLMLWMRRCRKNRRELQRKNLQFRQRSRPACESTLNVEHTGIFSPPIMSAIKNRCTASFLTPWQVQVDLEEYDLVTASTDSSAAGPANAKAIIGNCILAKECRLAFGPRENFEDKEQKTKFENIPAELQSAFAPHSSLFLPGLLLKLDKGGAMTHRNAHKEVA